MPRHAAPCAPQGRPKALAPSGGGGAPRRSGGAPVTSPPNALAQFERMLAAGKDSALLRFSLGNEYLKAGDAAAAITHLARAVELDANTREHRVADVEAELQRVDRLEARVLEARDR